jgi:hypothetical protein
MTIKQNTVQQQIMCRARDDEAFRQEMLSHPRAALFRHLGISLPAGVQLHVHEDTARDVHLVLPAQEGAGGLQDLSDAELEQVSGGQATAPVQDEDELALAFGNVLHSVVYPR